MPIVAFCSPGTSGGSDASRVRCWLLVPADGIVWPLRRPLVVGRAPLRHLEADPDRACDLLVVDDADVSRVHLEFVPIVDGSVMVEPLGGEVRIERDGAELAVGQNNELRRNDIVRFGSVEMRLVATGPSVATGPIAPVPVTVHPQTRAQAAT